MSRCKSFHSGASWLALSSEYIDLVAVHLLIARPEVEKPKAKAQPAKSSMISGGSMISAAPPKQKKPTQEELASMPPLFRPKQFKKPSREEALARTDGLAKGFVLLDVSSGDAEEAWSWILEGKDEPTICGSSEKRYMADGQITIMSFSTNMPKPSRFPL